MAIKSIAERRDNNRRAKIEERERKRALGLIPMEVWIPSQHKEKLKLYVERLTKKP